MNKRWARRALSLVGGSAVLYALLLIPEQHSPVPPGAGAEPFRWNSDERWFALERTFVASRAQGCSHIAPRVDSLMTSAQSLVASISSTPLPPDHVSFRTLEHVTFELGSLLAACSERVEDYRMLVSAVRTVVKHQSESWDMNDHRVRECLYRLLYGSRAALEEVLLQLPPESVPMILPGVDEPSVTPAIRLLGVTIRSGDILVSRGGAPTSSLIARGNDFPGNFSHVAIIHIDASTGKPTIIESHIERGVAISQLEEYLLDVKLRILVLRLRHDLPAVTAKPQIPHLAAQNALASAGARHIPYDFALDYRDTSKMFCSEVASWAYHHEGIELWKGMSTISSHGVVSWLSDFGVAHFETMQPSDLEYDPQLRVVAEWRDAQTLFKDHIDNAVMETLLDGAEQGEQLKCSWYVLPIARAMKVYSVFLNVFGGVGPIPEGMSASAALRHEYFTEMHRALAQSVAVRAEEFRRDEGYVAPYWELLKFARHAKIVTR